MEGSGEEAQAVGAPASWLFQAVSSPHRHQAYLKDQGHRKGGSFSVFLLFLCKALFWLSTLPKGGREREGLVGVDDGFGGFYRADGGVFGEFSGENVRGGGRNVEGSVDIGVGIDFAFEEEHQSLLMEEVLKLLSEES